MPLEDIDELSEIEDYERLSVLFAQLPRDSRYIKKKYPSEEWSTAEYLLWSIEYSFRSLNYGMISKKDRAGIPEPKPLQTPREYALNVEHKINAEQNRSEINKILGMEGE